MRLAVPDLISNSYFPSISAVELGDFAEQGLDVSHELIFPVDKCYRALRDGEVDLIGGSAHAVLSAFPRWEGAKLLCSLSQGMYWFLVMRADEGHARGDLGAVRGKKIGAAPWVDIGLKRMLREGGIDIERDGVEIAPVPGTTGPRVSFGVTAARALEDGLLDGFWANGMGAEIAVTRGVGTVVADVRRGDGPKPAFSYTQPVLVATETAGRRAPRRCRRRGARHRLHPAEAQAGSRPRDGDRREAVRAKRGEADRPSGRARPAVLRPCDPGRLRRRHDRVRPRHGDPRPDGPLRQRGRDRVRRALGLSYFTGE